LVEGLLTALSELDEVISFCGRRVMAVRQKLLQSRFNLSEEQSDAILAMPLRRLTGLERQNLRRTNQSTNSAVAAVTTSDRRELLKALKKT